MTRSVGVKGLPDKFRRLLTAVGTEYGNDSSGTLMGCSPFY
jgi:hypothetical protein